MVNLKAERLEARRFRVRKKIKGSATRPRFSVAKTLKHIYAQLVDDELGRTLVFASSLSPEVRSQMKQTGNAACARVVGELLGKKALAQGIAQVVFDRGGRLYHGRVRAVADGARTAGLKF